MPSDRVLLTGATGTIGSAVLEVLAETGRFAIDCLIRRATHAPFVQSRGGAAVIGDMADSQVFEGLRLTQRYAFIVHTAQAHYSQHSADEIDRLDRIAVRNLERLCDESTRLMVYTSGVWIFGHQVPGSVITECSPLRPFSAAARRAELVSELRDRSAFPWAQLCPPSIVYGAIGPSRDIERSLQAGPVDVVEDRSLLWSVIERYDLAHAYLALLRHGAARDFFVVAEDLPLSRLGFYERIAREIPGAEIRRRPADWFRARYDPAVCETLLASQPVDSRRFKSRTGWAARESFATSAGRWLNGTE